MSVHHAPESGEHRGAFTIYSRIPNVIHFDLVAVYPEGKMDLLDMETGKVKCKYISGSGAKKKKG